jgi:hypothetical protein
MKVSQRGRIRLTHFVSFVEKEDYVQILCIWSQDHF